MDTVTFARLLVIWCVFAPVIGCKKSGRQSDLATSTSLALAFSELTRGAQFSIRIADSSHCLTMNGDRLNKELCGDLALFRVFDVIGPTGHVRVVQSLTSGLCLARGSDLNKPSLWGARCDSGNEQQQLTVADFSFLGSVKFFVANGLPTSELIHIGAAIGGVQAGGKKDSRRDFSGEISWGNVPRLASLKLCAPPDRRYLSGIQIQFIGGLQQYRGICHPDWYASTLQLEGDDYLTKVSYSWSVAPLYGDGESNMKRIVALTVTSKKGRKVALNAEEPHSQLSVPKDHVIAGFYGVVGGIEFKVEGGPIIGFYPREIYEHQFIEQLGVIHLDAASYKAHHPETFYPDQYTGNRPIEQNHTDAIGIKGSLGEVYYERFSNSHMSNTMRTSANLSILRFYFSDDGLMGLALRPSKVAGNTDFEQVGIIDLSRPEQQLFVELKEGEYLRAVLWKKGEMERIMGVQLWTSFSRTVEWEHPKVKDQGWLLAFLRTDYAITGFHGRLGRPFPPLIKPGIITLAPWYSALEITDGVSNP